MWHAALGGAGAAMYGAKTGVDGRQLPITGAASDAGLALATPARREARAARAVAADRS